MGAQSMASRAVILGAQAVFGCLIATLCWSAAFAVGDAKPFNVGDRVEAKDGFEWKLGTVTAIDVQSGLITVRIDTEYLEPSARVAQEVEERFERQVPLAMREAVRSRSLTPDQVRPTAAARAEKRYALLPSRTWTDLSGKFKIDARYGGLEGGKTVLVKLDGSKISVPLEKLSSQDRSYIKDLIDPPENPFTDTEASDSAESVLQQANWRDAKEIKPQKFSKWTFVPTSNGFAELSAGNGPSVQVPLKGVPGADVGINKVEGVFSSSDHRRVLICRQKGSIEAVQFLELVDVSRKESRGLTPLPKQTLLLDADLDAGLVLYRSNEYGHEGNKGILTVAKFAPNELTAIARWEPFGQTTRGMDNQIEQARILSSDRVLTLDRFGRMVVIWDVTQPKAIWKIPIGSAQILSTALSPDRKLLAISAEQGISIIDLEAGRHVATIPPDGRVYHSLAFRADNARLGAFGDMSLKVWDLADGHSIVNFMTPSSIGSYDVALAWTGSYLLVGNNYLFDVDRRILLWEYQESSLTTHNASLRNGVLWIVPFSHGESTLVSSPVPHPAALAMVRQLPSADELIVAKPGDPVSIEIDMDANVVLPNDVERQIASYVDAAEGRDGSDGRVVMLKQSDSKKDVVRRQLAIALKEAGYEVVNSSSLVLRFVCKPQPEQTILINVDGRSPARPEDFVEKTITPHATCLSFILNGEAVWENGFVAKPHMIIYLEKGETLDEALERLSRPNMVIFSLMKFSSPLARPGKATENGAYGVSVFTSNGLTDGKNARTDIKRIGGSL